MPGRHALPEISAGTGAGEIDRGEYHPRTSVSQVLTSCCSGAIDVSRRG